MSDPGRRPPAPLGGRWAEGVPLGRVLGIPIVFAPSWFLIAAFITVQYAGYVGNRLPHLGSVTRYVVAASFALLLYASVLVHELSHSVVAKSLGLPVLRIRLQLLGGVSEITQEPQTPAREYLVAIAGPLMSILIGGVALAAARAIPQESVPKLLIGEIAVANGLVAVFNLLPGLPLDGGRVLRAGLWRLTGNKVRGTAVAAWIGRGLAVVVAVTPFVVAVERGSTAGNIGIIYSVFLGLFIWAGATQTLAQTKLASALPSLSARALARRALPVSSDLPVAEAVRRAHAAGARALVIVDSRGRPDGLVSEAAVSALPEARRPWVAVSAVSRGISDDLVLRADMTGQPLLEALRRQQSGEYLVLESDGRVYGVLAQADVLAALQRAGE